MWSLPNTFQLHFKNSFWAHTLQYWVTVQFSMHTPSPKNQSLSVLAGHRLPPSDPSADRVPLSGTLLVGICHCSIGVLPALCVCVAWISLTSCIHVNPSLDLGVLCPGRGGSCIAKIFDQALHGYRCYTCSISPSNYKISLPSVVKYLLFFLASKLRIS